MFPPEALYGYLDSVVGMDAVDLSLVEPHLCDRHSVMVDRDGNHFGSQR